MAQRVISVLVQQVALVTIDTDNLDEAMLDVLDQAIGNRGQIQTVDHLGEQLALSWITNTHFSLVAAIRGVKFTVTASPPQTEIMDT